MVSGGSPAIQAYGGRLAPLAKDSSVAQLCPGRCAPFSLSSPAPKSVGSCRSYLAKGSPATQIRGGEHSSPVKMNNNDASSTNPGGVARASTAMLDSTFVILCLEQVLITLQSPLNAEQKLITVESLVRPILARR